MSGALDDILASFTPAGEGFTAQIPEHWMQGRTAYGGLSTALAHAAARRLMPDLPPLRAALVAFIGPVGETVTLGARQLRRGKSTAFVEADAYTEADGLGLRASFLFAAERESALTHPSPPMPDVPPPEDCPSLFGGGPLRISFQSHFEPRFAGGARPVSGGEPDLLVWSRLREPFGGDPITELLALADALPPAMLSKATGPARVSSMTWNIDLMTPHAPTRDRWRLLRARATSAAHGYSVQEMGVWTTDGECVLTGSQAVAAFT